MTESLDLLTGNPLNFPIQTDLINTLNTKRIDLYNGLGFIEIVDMMPRCVPVGHTADLAIARNARVSYALNAEPSSGDTERLVRYLSEHWHTSPSESVVFQFRGRVPIYVSRHIDRHRTARSNYESGRYIVMKDEYHLPELRMQSENNKQGSSDAEIPAIASALWSECQLDVKEIANKYNRLVEMGVAKEVARTILPQSLMTTFMWQMDLHNLLNFLRLRMDSHAQQETREFADAVMELISPLVPASIRAFNDFQQDTLCFDKEEQRFMTSKTKLGPRKMIGLVGKLQKINVQLSN